MPKAYEVTHRIMMLQILVQLGADAMALRRSDRVLPVPQFFHGIGWSMPLTAFMAGAAVILPGRDLNGRRLAKVIGEQRVTVAGAVPTLWHDIIKAVSTEATLRPDALREVLVGGAAVPSTIIAGIKESLGATAVNVWGMTENMGMCTFEREAPETCLGRPVPLHEYRIVRDENGQATRSGTGGALQERGPLTIAPVDKDGWFGTGDIASFDSGILTFRDREKDVIKSGGEWIPSQTLENRLLQYPSIEAAAIVAIPHERFGERPFAFLVTDGEANRPAPEVLGAFLQQVFPRWWVPEQFEWIGTLPLTKLGEIDKQQLRKQALNHISPTVDA